MRATLGTGEWMRAINCVCRVCVCHVCVVCVCCVSCGDEAVVSSCVGEGDGAVEESTCGTTCSQVSIETVLNPSISASSTFLLSPYLNHSVNNLRTTRHDTRVSQFKNAAECRRVCREGAPEGVLEALALGREGDRAEEAGDGGHEVGRDLVVEALLLVVGDDLEVGARPRVPRLVPVVVVLGGGLERRENVRNGGLGQVVVELALPLAQGEVAPGQQLGVVLQVPGEDPQPLERVLLVPRVVHVLQIVERHPTM